MSDSRLGTERASSSGAAKGTEQALVAGKDAGDVGGLRRRVPLVPLERAAEQYPIGAGEHISTPGGDGVANLRLGQQDGELAAHRVKLHVAEQVSRAEAGAVEHQPLRQGAD